MSPRRSAAVALSLVLAFGVLVVIGGSVNFGYAHSRDYVSSLAGRGADHAWIGVLAIACFAAAHAVAAAPWRARARLVWMELLGCAGLLMAVALARATCAGGAARCSLPGESSATDVLDIVHGAAVGIYALLFLAAAGVAGGVLLLRRRWLGGAAAVAVAVLSLLALGRFDETTPGSEQRVWLAVNALGLLAIAALATSVEPRGGSTAP